MCIKAHCTLLDGANRVNDSSEDRYWTRDGKRSMRLLRMDSSGVVASTL